MNSKERFLTAMRNGLPDRVPVCPDISNYIPVKRTGLPFWKVYFTEEYPLWKAYMDAADHFKLDMWVASCLHIPAEQRENVTVRDSLKEFREPGSMIRERRYRTPDGEMTAEELCFAGEPPTHLKRIIGTIDEDWKKFRWLLQDPVRIDASLAEEIRRQCEQREQAFGLTVSYPGFQHWEGLIEGGIITLSYLEMDRPAVLEEWMELHMAQGTALVEQFLDLEPDYLCLGGSGTLTMASPPLVEKYALPAIKEWTAMAKEKNVPTVLHSCGRSRLLVDLLAEQTDLSCVNPLEIPPMGDVDLAEVSRSLGDRIALMGNLHTTDVMLRGTPDDVYRASVKAIKDAGAKGGFILSTGDQCPRETPDENIFAMHQAVEDAGRYNKELM